MYITSNIMQINKQDAAASETVDCYPHNFDCLSVLVPRTNRHELFLKEIAKRKSVWAILITFGMFVVLRSIVTGDNLIISNHSTLAILLAQHFWRKRQMRPSECLWMMLMMVFALFLTTILSSLFFVSLVNYKYVPQIDTIDQLAESGLTILVNDEGEDIWDFSK